MRREGFNGIKQFSTILQFSVLRIARGGGLKVRKIPIFEYKPAPNCSTVKNFYMRELDLNKKKKTILAILEFQI